MARLVRCRVWRHHVKDAKVVVLLLEVGQTVDVGDVDGGMRGMIIEVIDLGVI